MYGLMLFPARGSASRGLRAALRGSISNVLAQSGIQTPGGPSARAVSSAGAPAPLSSRPSSQIQHLDIPTYTVWGANTDVGKTLISAGLAASVARKQGDLFYIKPVQTGFPEDSDARLVCAAAGGSEQFGPHAKRLLTADVTEEPHESASGSSGIVLGKTLFAWSQAVGPHLAVQTEGSPVSDAEVVQAVTAELSALPRPSAAVKRDSAAPSLALVETAGGVASPGPSGALQCDLLRPLRLPAVLVGDSRLGGISCTIAALESLHIRGYDTVAVVLTEGSLANNEAISAYLKGRAPVFCLPACSKPPASSATAHASVDANLLSWLDAATPQLDALLDHLAASHRTRINRLAGLSQEARDVLWWPFTQHANISNNLVTVLDSRCGDDFAVFRPPLSEAAEGSAPGVGSIEAQFDACASWWTQGLGAELQPVIAREMGYAAGRYGHLMFPENAHEPATELAKELLEGPGKGWASRVFYSDDGSTALEVAVKMAFRKYIMDNEAGSQADVEEEGVGDSKPDLHIVGLTDSYHGDTLGCMDLSAPSAFNGRMQTPWYQPRGLFLEPPTVGMSNRLWGVELPTHYAVDADSYDTEFSSLEEVFDTASRSTHSLAALYRQRIGQALGMHPTTLAACVMEPVLQGAGGMRMIDPMWQTVAVEECRARGLPVVFDEVFAGLWRLGRISASEMLGVTPDVACYAKLLTGGTLPLAATVATESVFKAFDGPTKVESLLHGHSYSAHPIGCHAGVVSLRAYTDPQLNPNYRAPKSVDTDSSAPRVDSGSLTPLWDCGLVADISCHPKVKRVVAIGTVFAAELEIARGSESGGYLSSAAQEVTRELRTDGIFARPLGNVVYLMASPFTDPLRCKGLLQKLIQVLG